MEKSWQIFILILLTLSFVNCEHEKPNVIIILSDDQGSHDVSFRGGSDIPTPNIDALAMSGVILDRYYSGPMCSPSRSELLTGKYAIRTGLPHFVIVTGEPWGLGLEEKLLPEYLKEAGYKTNLVGKWHLGFFKESYTPTQRGFDSFFGYLGSHIDYYDHTCLLNVANYSRGYDMRQNMSVVEKTGIYATELFTREAVKVIKNHDSKDPLFLLINHLAPHAGNEDKPLQAPAEKVEKFNHIKDPRRRTLAAMVSLLDDSVGRVVEALKLKGILENSVIFYLSDNGGPTVGLHSTAASNYPLRGQKQSGWEGAVRNIGFVYSPLIEQPQRVSRQLFHITDLLPTILSFTDVKVTGIDGVNQWSTISKGDLTSRNEIVNNIDPIDGYGAYIYKNYKIVNGSVLNGQFDGWLGSSTIAEENCYATNVMNSVASKAIQSVQQSSQHLTIRKITELRNEATIVCRAGSLKTLCDLKAGPCLFDIFDDPCEENNLAESNQMIMEVMQQRLNSWAALGVMPRNQPTDPACNPAFFNFTWSPWR